MAAAEQTQATSVQAFRVGTTRCQYRAVDMQGGTHGDLIDGGSVSRSGALGRARAAIAAAGRRALLGDLVGWRE